ncbi:hypothetical protein OPT61_g9118 [Boeremia exigua]|uniref:Uncharacterized protein n=1 Tax=Boeremia exigua TaxID=749465 RepID=A0ACC2HWC8_9PLEO|nr:hypothetical protein OPT61_g9118 [Boeremia exigua]
MKKPTSSETARTEQGSPARLKSPMGTAILNDINLLNIPEQYGDLGHVPNDLCATAANNRSHLPLRHSVLPTAELILGNEHSLARAKLSNAT